MPCSGSVVGVEGGGGGRPVQRDLTTMRILKEDPQLHFEGVP